MDKNRERADNWTQEEKELFIEIMRESGKIIENKKTDTNTNQLKRLEWLKVEKRFRELSGNNRSIAQLKGVWRRLKITSKKNVSQHRRSVNATGGGQRPPSPSEEDKKMIEICPTDFVVEDNIFDSDSIFLNDMSQSQPKEKLKVIIDDHDYKFNIIDNENMIQEEESIDDDVVACIYNNKELPVEKTSLHAKQKKRQQSAKATYSKAETSQKAAIFKTNLDLKQKSLKLVEEEYALKFKYQENELNHQKIKHQLEIDILILEKEKKQLELEALKKHLRIN